jgi:adenylate kinase family enzyme
LEIIGEPGAGKSTLIEFLWKLLGRPDYEGFDPSKSSFAARARNFAQVSNLPIVLIEGDRQEDTRRVFDWDELKTAYNGRSLRATGIKNGGNDTREPPFRGALVISQNRPVEASEAILQRIIQCQMDRSGQTPQTKALAEKLERFPLEAVSGFLLAAITQEERLLKTFQARVTDDEQSLQAQPDLSHLRLIKNHAQLMALVDALAQVIPLTDTQQSAARDQLRQMAIARQQAIQADHPLVQEFWECFDYLESGELASRLNHARDAQLIAVNLNHFATVAAEYRQHIPPLVELKPLLRTSKTRKFVGIKSVRSALHTPASSHIPAVLTCWIFRRG